MRGTEVNGVSDVTTIFRAGNLAPHKGRFFGCATRAAAEKWAIDLGRPLESVQAVEIDGKLSCVVNTHGYVEADFRYGDLDPRPWDDTEYLVKLASLARVYRVEMTVEEAVAILSLLADEPAYQSHEIVWGW